MASSSSPATDQVMKYDVFLSFRGEDTRNNFTSHVFGALRRKNINTFIDNKLCRGDEISPSLLNAIKGSQISVIIFSENYAASGWCLQELEQILCCRRVNRQIVIPVFYRVDPSDVRHQKGKFGDAFAKLQERLKERLDELRRWKASLEEAANLSGCHINDNKPENEFIDIIVDDISKKLSNLSPVYQGDMVGAQFSLEKVKSLLQIGSKGPHIIGIWGIGGIGKTTIARAVFYQIRCEFEGSYFAANVREEWEKSPGLKHLQKELLREILRDKKSRKKMLGGKKLLIIFDDVTRFDQIEKLIGDANLLGSGSQIIITTRDKHVLKNCGVDDSNIYKVEGLCHDDALQLFCKNAFRQICPPADYVELSNIFLTYAKGVPLVLKILGRFLCDKIKKDWESQMEKLEKSPHEDIQNVLKISYDGLDKEEKNIFLDIACFFKEWEINSVKYILDASGYFSQIGLSRLIDKCLVSIVERLVTESDTITLFESRCEIITMHDLLEDMGKEIVRQESDDPQRRSRLWHHEDIYNVLRKNKGGEEIQAICLDESKINDIKLDPRSFSKMPKLRFFRVYGTQHNFPFRNYESKLHGFQELESFSTVVFFWNYYPLKSLPLNFQVENLVRLDMRCSSVELLWIGVQDLGKLRHIDLSYSEHLKKVPDLSKAVNLQNLNLSHCKSLEILPDTILSKSIDLSGCDILRVVPRISNKVEVLKLKATAIKELPFIEDQSRLVTLDLSLCSQLESLSSSIFKCKCLEYLDVSSCQKLERLVEDMGNLDALKTPLARGNGLANCQLMELPIDLVQSSFPRELNPFENNFESFKDLSNLHFLDVSYCNRLISLPQLPRGIEVSASFCSSLESILDTELPLDVSPMLRPQRVDLHKCFKVNLSKSLHKETGRKIFNNVRYPGNQIPEWFDFKDEGSHLHQNFEQYLTSENVIGFNMCVVVEVGSGKDDGSIWWPCSIKVRVNKIEANICTMSCQSDLLLPWEARDGSSSFVCMDFVSIPKNDIGDSKGNEEYTKKNNTSLYISFDVDSVGYKIKRCGVHFVYGCRHLPYTSAMWCEDDNDYDLKLMPCYEELQEEDGESYDIESLFLSSSLTRKRRKMGCSSGKDGLGGNW